MERVRTRVAANGYRNSVTLYFQKESPGKDKEANWLPAPKGQFILMLRMYGPKVNAPSILDTSWSPPAVKKAG